MDMQEFLDYQETGAIWNAQEYIDYNKDIRMAMETWDEQFIETYREGFNHYIAGEWASAKSKFDLCRKTYPGN